MFPFSADLSYLMFELGTVADQVVSASSVPPPWGGQSSSPKGLNLYLWLRPQRLRGKKLPRLPHIQSTCLWPTHLTELRCRCVWVG